jgi:D-3-phosphoglycerate dehydrogenase
LNDSTRHIVSTNELASMKHGGILINCARGGVVDNSALVEAIESGHIRAAGVDVMPIEPPPAYDPLVLHPNVLMTPHNAAGAMSAAIAMSEMSAQNVVDMFAGKLEGDCIFNHDYIR